MAAADKEDLAEKARIARLRATDESIKLANQKKSKETAKEATEKVLMAGGSSTDKANRLPGETASQANERITKAYKELTAKPVLSQEQIDAGAKVQFVRTGAGGKGEYTIVVPPGYKGEKTTTQWTDGIIPGGSKYTTGSSVGKKITGGKVSTATATTKGGKTEDTGSKFQNTFAGQQAARIEKLRADAAAGKKITLQDLGDFRTIYYDKDPVTGKQRTGKEVVDAMLADLNLVDPNELLKSGGTTLVNEQTKEVRPQNLAEIKQNILEQIAYEAKAQSKYSAYAQDVYNYLKGNASQGIRGILAKDPTLWKGGYSPADVGKIVAGKSSDPNDKRSVYIIDPNNPVIPEDILAKIQGQNIPIIDPTTGNAVGFDPRTRSVVDFGGSLGRVTPKPGYDYLGNYTGDTQVDASGNIIEPSSNNMFKDFGINTNMSFDANGNPIQGMSFDANGNPIQGTSSTQNLSEGFGEGGPTLARDTFKNTLALFFGKSEMSNPWVDALYSVVAKYVNTGSDIQEALNLSLQDVRNNPVLKPFTDRFKGLYALQDRLAKGEAVSVPTIAEFFKSEVAMGDILRNVGLGELATQDFLGDVLGRGKSVLEVSNLINSTFESIDNAPTQLKQDLQKFFPGVDRTALAKALLTGTEGWKELDRKIRGISVLSAAKSQGIDVSLTSATDLADMGYNYADSLQGFQTVKKLERGAMLGQISGIQFGQEEAIGATFKSSAKAIEDIGKLTALEQSRFAGSSGRLASRSRAQGAF